MLPSMKRLKVLSKLEELLHLLLLATPFLVILPLLILPAVILDKVAVQLLAPTLLVVGENETDASLCAANASDVLRLIISSVYVS